MLECAISSPKSFVKPKAETQAPRPHQWQGHYSRKARSINLFRRKASILAGDVEAGEALVDRHQLDDVDVDVWRQRGHPVDGLGNVLRGHRVHIAVKRIRR